MSDQTVFAMPSNISFKGIADYMGLHKKPVTDSMLQDLLSIQQIFNNHKIDAESAVGILRSYESKFSTNDISVSNRILNFKNFLSTFSDKDDLMSKLDNIGIMSKSELESYANDTGNWIPFMKKCEAEKNANK